MATTWILGKVSEAIAPTVSHTVSTAGGFAGDVVSAFGESINGVGQSINRAISCYGNAVKDRGNEIKDFTKAEGFRVPTANNPLGLSGTSYGGMRAIASPGAMMKSYTKSSPQKALPAVKSAPNPAGSRLRAGEPVKHSTVTAKPPAASINSTQSRALVRAASTSRLPASKPPYKPTTSPAKKTPLSSPATSSTPAKKNPLSSPATSSTPAKKNPLSSPATSSTPAKKSIPPSSATIVPGKSPIHPIAKSTTGPKSGAAVRPRV